MKADRGLGDRLTRIDQLGECPVFVDPPAGNADPGDGNDLVAVRRLQARGFRVEHHEGQVLQHRTAQFFHMHGRVQPVEIVKFRARR